MMSTVTYFIYINKLSRDDVMRVRRAMGMYGFDLFAHASAN